jgi:hypothetical protein
MIKPPDCLGQFSELVSSAPNFLERYRVSDGSIREKGRDLNFVIPIDHGSVSYFISKFAHRHYVVVKQVPISSQLTIAAGLKVGKVSVDSCLD